ncbi:MAG: hypothetical protein AAF919_10825 [Pseudomonadota bacterium]
MTVIYDYREFFRYVTNFNQQAPEVRENIAESYFEIASLGVTNPQSQDRLLAYGLREVLRMTGTV